MAKVELGKIVDVYGGKRKVLRSTLFQPTVFLENRAIVLNNHEMATQLDLGLAKTDKDYETRYVVETLADDDLLPVELT